MQGSDSLAGKKVRIEVMTELEAASGEHHVELDW